jgi:hypothetical protein
MKFKNPWTWLAAGLVVVAVLGSGYWLATRHTTNPNPGPSLLTDEPPVPDGPPWFRDVTATTGIDFTYRNGEEADEFSILESVGGGVGMIDFDGDGLLDLFLPGGGTFDKQQIKGHPCKLYQNLGNWKFRDVTAEVGLDKIDFYSHGCAVADYDKDGWPDLLVTGYGRVALFRNEPNASGGRRFADVTAKSGLRDTSWSTSAGWADLTGSGYPDLYICHYVDWSFANNPVCKGKGPDAGRDVCPPQQFKPLVHALYRNLGDGTFRDATKELKLRNDGSGLGVVFADFRGDAKPSIYVANDATNNHLYLNAGGKLNEKAQLAGVAVDEHGMYNGSMGVDVADYDGSGRASLFFTNFQGEIHGLYRNLGKDRFNYQSNVSGLASLSRHFVGFGTGFVDVDNDGWEDLFIVNGHVVRKPLGSTFKQEQLLLRNVESRVSSPLPPGEGSGVRARRTFQNYSKRGGPYFATPAVARGLAIGDLDNDGWPDAVVNNINSPVVVLRNEASKDNPARWLGVKLIGKAHRDIVGSTITLETSTRTLTRFAKGGGNYLSSSDRRLLFGLGPTDQPKRLTVKWAWGSEQTWETLEPGCYWELRESDPAAKRIP